MKKTLIVTIVVITLIALSMLVCQGCATIEYHDETCDFKSTTIGKDIVVDPNGVMSTVSPKNQGIIEAFLGGLAGFFVGIGI